MKEIEKSKKKAERGRIMPQVKLTANIADVLTGGIETKLLAIFEGVTAYNKAAEEERVYILFEGVIQKIQKNEKLNWKELEDFINLDNSFFFRDIIHATINSHSDKIKFALAIIYAKYWESDKEYKYVRMFHSITKITDIDFDVFLEIGDIEKNKRFYRDRERHHYNENFFNNGKTFDGENILRYDFHGQEDFSEQIISDYNLGDISHLYTILHQLIHSNLLLYHGGVQGLSGGYSLGGFCFNLYSSEIYQICKEASEMNELRKTEPSVWYKNLMSFI